LRSDELERVVRRWGELSEWRALSKEVLTIAPREGGIYIIRMAQGRVFGRLRGSSDILYIGSAKRLRRRLRGYFYPGPTQWTNKRVHAMMSKHPMEIAWCITEDYAEAERELLRLYLDQHDELPPFNRATKRLP